MKRMLLQKMFMKKFGVINHSKTNCKQSVLLTSALEQETKSGLKVPQYPKEFLFIYDEIVSQGGNDKNICKYFSRIDTDRYKL